MSTYILLIVLSQEYVPKNKANILPPKNLLKKLSLNLMRIIHIPLHFNSASTEVLVELILTSYL